MPGWTRSSEHLLRAEPRLRGHRMESAGRLHHQKSRAPESAAQPARRDAPGRQARWIPWPQGRWRTRHENPVARPATTRRHCRRVESLLRNLSTDGVQQSRIWVRIRRERREVFACVLLAPCAYAQGYMAGPKVTLFRCRGTGPLVLSRSRADCSNSTLPDQRRCVPDVQSCCARCAASGFWLSPLEFSRPRCVGLTCASLMSCSLRSTI